MHDVVGGDADGGAGGAVWGAAREGVVFECFSSDGNCDGVVSMSIPST